MVMSTLWSPSRAEMKTAWLEEHGIGACSGREFHLARERRPRESTPPCPTGTQHANTHPCCVCLHLSSLHPLCPALSWPLTPHVFVLSLALLSVFACCLLSCMSPHPTQCILYAWPHPHSVRTVCTVPLIDSIHGQKFTIEPQGGGDQNGFARGAWDWSMLWKRVPLGDREKNLRKTQTEPYRYKKPVPHD